MLLSLAEPRPQMLSALESTWKSAWGKKGIEFQQTFPTLLILSEFFSHFFTSFCDQLRINHDKRGRKKRQEALETAAEALRIFVEINDRKFEAGLFFSEEKSQVLGKFRCWHNAKRYLNHYCFAALGGSYIDSHRNGTLQVLHVRCYVGGRGCFLSIFFRQSKTWNEVNWACLYDFFSDALEIHWNPTFRDCWIHNRF